MLKKNTAGQFVHFQGVDATTGGIKSGVTWTMRRCLDGTFAAGGATITEDGTTGWYKVALAQADTNGNNVGYNFTGSGCVPQTINVITDGAPPSVNVATVGGGTVPSGAIPNAVAGATGGLFIAGTNAATTVTTALTTTFTGNLTGSVASVTGNVGGNVIGDVITGTVNDASATTTDFDGDSGLSASDDFYTGSVLAFTAGTLKGIARKITGYTGATRNLQFTAAFPTAPTNGDAFEILGRID